MGSNSRSQYSVKLTCHDCEATMEFQTSQAAFEHGWDCADQVVLCRSCKHRLESLNQDNELRQTDSPPHDLPA
jgi:C4-type Zn-finger protein